VEPEEEAAEAAAVEQEAVAAVELSLSPSSFLRLP
jgi:hypothetical protein